MYQLKQYATYKTHANSEWHSNHIQGLVTNTYGPTNAGTWAMV